MWLVRYDEAMSSSIARPPEATEERLPVVFLSDGWARARGEDIILPKSKDGAAEERFPVVFRSEMSEAFCERAALS